MNTRTMEVNLVFGVKLFTTLVTLILESSWKVDVFHMAEGVLLLVADLPTQTALKLSFVFPFIEFLRICMKVKCNTISIFPSVLHFLKVMTCSQTVRLSMILHLHLQCSHFKHEYTAGVELRGEIVLKLLLSFCISAELRTLFLMVTGVLMLLLQLSMCRRHKCVHCFNFDVRRPVVVC